MSRDRRIDLRKHPTTEAGTQIFEAILAAAEHVLETHGPDKLTTNLVARRAGVSVGSLYQYFPNKNAILAHLARRIEQRTEAKLLAVFEESGDSPLRDTAERVVDTLLSEIGSVEMRRSLRLAVPAGWIAEASSKVDQTIRGRLAAEFSVRADVREGDYALMAWVVGHAIEHVVEQAVIFAPQLVDAPAFRGELVELAVRYLRR